VWGTQAALSSFSQLQLAHGAGARADDLVPCGLIREVTYLGVFTQEVYGPVITHLEQLGYRAGRDLFIFDYDWRRSAFDNARALAEFLNRTIPDPTLRVDILAHSMGGLIARIYALKFGGSPRISRLMSAGTPFLGSVKVFQSIESGWGLANFALGGIATFRRNMLSFPSIYELTARYGDCCEGASPGAAAFQPFDPRQWQTLGWDGVDPAAMPDLAMISERMRELADIIKTPLPDTTEDVMLVGTDQRTPYRFSIEPRGDGAKLRVATTWDGDGTVARESASVPHAPVFPTSFAEHERILNDPGIRHFLGVALSRGTAEAFRTVTVRPRSRVRTMDGQLRQLVGIAIATDQPMYRAGDTARVHVHVRLDARKPLSVDTLRLELRPVTGGGIPILLRHDPAGADPANPFEQSFAGDIRLGLAEGHHVLRASIAVEGSAPRIVERRIGAVAP
jgi:pimeloyl-ACP methyl ester carboxylesterase